MKDTTNRHLINLPHWLLRLLVALVGLPFTIPAFLLNGGINLIPMLFVLAILVWQSPNIREKFFKVPLEQRLVGSLTMIISLSLLAFIAPTHLWGLPFAVNYGIMSFFGSLSMISNPRKLPAFLEKLQATSAPKATKTVKPIQPKDPNRKKTNTQRRWEAKQAKLKNK